MLSYYRHLETSSEKNFLSIMKRHWKITTAAMILVVVVFLLFSKNYIFNKQNAVNGFILVNTTLSIWNEKSPEEYNYNPVLTYTNSGDKFVTYYKRLEDKEGNNYFVSFPPFSYILAYYFINALQLPMDITSLNILNLLILVAGSILVYFIINLITRKKIFDFSLASLSAMIVYLFIPINNYVAAATYAPELIFWLSSIFFFLKIILHHSQKVLHYILLGISVFLTVYTEWIGIFLGGSILSYCILNRKEEISRKLFIYVFLFMGLSLLLIFIQYSSLNGTAEMIHALKLRFLERSGFFGPKYSDQGIHIFSFSSWKLFLEKINLTLSGFGYLLLILVFIFILLKKKINYQQGIFKIIFFPLLLPLIGHVIILFNSNAIHLCCMPKIAVPVAILTGLLIEIFIRNYSRQYIKYITLMLIIITASASVTFLRMNISKDHNSIVAEKQGEYIKKYALPDEAVFISKDTSSDFFADLFLTYLSHRNLRYAQGIDDAVYISGNLKKTKGVYFEIHQDTALCKNTHFNINETITK
jgi:hypothetical protein